MWCFELYDIFFLLSSCRVLDTKCRISASLLWSRFVLRIACSRLWHLQSHFRAACNIMYVNDCPTRCDSIQFVYCRKLLYKFQAVTPPIIRSTYNCIYSVWYLLNITAVCLYCGRFRAGLSVVCELYRSVTYVTDRYNSHTTLRPAPNLPQ